MQSSTFAMRKAAWPVLALVLGGSGALVACGDDDEPAQRDDGGAGGKGSGGKGSGGSSTGGKNGGSGGSSVQEGGVPTTSVKFQAVVGTRPFDCSAKYAGLGTSKSELAPVDFRFYVHDLRVIDEDGEETPVDLTADGKWQTTRVALLDFENNDGTCANGNADIHDTIEFATPEAPMKGIAFRVGVPEDLNHANPVAAPSPLNLTALHWNWNFGYKFAKIDFKLVAGDGGMVMPDGGMVMPDGGVHGDGGMVMPDGGQGGGMNHGSAGSVLLHLGSVGCTTSDAGAASCSIKNRPNIRFAAFDPATQKVVLDYARLIENIDPAKDKGGAGACMGDPQDPECAEIFDAIGLQLSGEPKAEHPAFSVADQ